MADSETVYEEITLDELVESDAGLKKLMDADTNINVKKKLQYKAGLDLAKALANKLNHLQKLGIMDQSPGSILPNHKMSKEAYVEMLETKSWETYEQIASSNGYKAPKLMNVTLPSDKLINFSIVNWDKMTQDSEMGLYIQTIDPMVWDTEDGLCNPDSTLAKEFREILGNDLLGNQLNLVPETVNVELICKLPGVSTVWHKDSLACYGMEYLGRYVDENWQDQGRQVVKYWIPVFDGSNGHIAQFGESVLHGWKAGDVYEVKPQLGHGASNFGVAPFYSLTIIGMSKDSK